MMRIDTTRFGPLEIEDQRVLTFSKGVLGFPKRTRWTLLIPVERTRTRSAADGAFYWLQSLDEPSLAFLVTEPRVWVANYNVPNAGADDLVLAIVNRFGRDFSINLRGPIVINEEGRCGEQLVRSDDWPVRHLIALAAEPAKETTSCPSPVK